MPVTVADLLTRFSADTSGLDRGIDSSNQKISRFSSVTGGAFSSLQTVGAVALGVAGSGIAALGAGMAKTAVDGTKMAADLESQISGIAAVLGASADDVAPLKNAILELGINPNLKVSTLEAADAMEMLARNGLNMQQIMDGAAEATVLLSNATGGDFSQAADIMTDAMAIFGESAGSYQDAVNGVVSVTNASKFSVDDYALALAQAGGVAGSVGVEFDDFNTSIAAISSLFGSGSDAGTSFKTMLSRLVPGSDDAKSAMRDLGLVTTDWEAAAKSASRLLGAEVEPNAVAVTKAFEQYMVATGQAEAGTKKMGSAITDFVDSFDINQFFDANGALKDMGDIAGLLQTSLADLSEEQKNQALQTIFGSDAMRAAVGLAKTGKDGFEELQAQMGKTDAIDSAATRMDNARGAMEILGGVIETVKIQIGDAFLPIIKQLAQELSTFVDQNSGAIVTFFGGFAQWIGNAAGYIPTLLDGVVSLWQGLSNLWTGFQNLITAIQPFVAWLSQMIAPIIQTVSQFVGWQDVLAALGVAIASVVIPAIISFVAAMAPIVATVAAVIAASALLRNAWEGDWGGIQTKTLAVWEWLKGTFEALQTWFNETFPDGLSGLLASWNENWQAMQAGLETIWGVISATWTTISTWLTETLPTSVTSLRNSWATGWENVKNTTSTQWTNIRGSFDSMKSWLDSTLPTSMTGLSTSTDANFETIKTSIVGKFDTVIATFRSIQTWLTDTLQAAMNSFKNALSGLTFSNPFQSIVNAISAVPDAISSARQTISDFVSWLGGLRIPDIFSILQLPDWLADYVGGGDGKSGGRSAGRSALVGASAASLALPTGGGIGVDVDTLAVAIVRAFAAAPPVVRAEFVVSVKDDPNATAVSYQMARRVGEILNRRTS